VQGSRLALWGLVLLTLAALAATLVLASPFLAPLAWALAIAVVTAPIHHGLRRRIPEANVAAVAAVLVVMIVVVTPIFLVGRVIAIEVIARAGSLPDADDAERWTRLAERHPSVAPFARWLDRRINVRTEAKQMVSRFVGYVSGVLGGSVWVIVDILLVLFFLFYFYRDGPRGLDTIRALLPLGESESTLLFERVAATIHATFRGTLVVASVQGVLGGLMFWILGLPAALVWGVIMGLFAIVPVLGPFLVWIPAALWLLLEGSWVRALVLVAWGSLVVSLVDNLLYPWVVGRELELHTVLVFLSLVGGILFFGGSGIVLGPLVLAILLSLIEVWRLRIERG
jgi:predicted PurR-regulated permease PerM